MQNYTFLILGRIFILPCKKSNEKSKMSKMSYS